MSQPASCWRNGVQPLADNVTPPPEACATWKAMYNGINELIDDLMDHISLENNVLFPCAAVAAHGESRMALPPSSVIMRLFPQVGGPLPDQQQAPAPVR